MKKLLTTFAISFIAVFVVHAQSPYGRILTLDDNGAQQWIDIGTVLANYVTYHTSSSSPTWLTSGSKITSGAFLGTTNSMPLIFKTNNIERMRISETGALIFNGSAGNNGDVLTVAGGVPTWAPPSGGSGWGLTGNSGTTAGTNFIGTTDDADLHLDVRSTGGTVVEQSLRMNTNQAIYRESTITGITPGNTRGPYAVDMQIDRNDAAKVASGYGSTVGGGQSNTASGNGSTVGGGQSNTAFAYYSTVGGGESNTASGYGSTVSGGYGNTASGWHSAVGGGYLNTASAYYSTVGGGNTNTASDWYSTVGGGQSNTASSENSTVGGGESNTASGKRSAVGGGKSNTASGENSTVGGGHLNTANGSYSTVGGGQSNTAFAYYSTVGGGYLNTASGWYSTVGGGYYAVANKYGQNAQASGRFATDGDAQTSVFVARNETTVAGWTTLYLDGAGATQSLTIPNNATWFFKIYVIAKPTGSTTNGAAYEITGVVTNNGGTATLLGTPVVTTLYESNVNYNAQVIASGANLVVQVEGNGDVLGWVARIETAEVTW